MKKIWFQAIGIDIGTEYIRMWTPESTEFTVVPSYVAVDEKDALLTVGEDARALSERNTTGIRVIRPIERGVIQDEVAAKMLLRAVLGKARWISWLIAPVVMVSVPSQATLVQRERVERLLKELGARVVYVVPQALAAAIGGGVPAQDASGTVVVQLGAGSVEAAAISLGGIVAATSCEFGGRSLLEQLRRLSREQYGVDISHETARKLVPLLRFGETKNSSLEVVGKDIRSGEPVRFNLESKQYEPAVLEQLHQIIETIRQLLSQVPPAITTDIVDRGMLFSGGLAQLHGLQLLFSQRLEVPCLVMEDPEMTVIKGLQFALLHLDEYLAAYE